MTALRRRFKKKITTKGGKGDEQAQADEEARKRNEEAQRLAQEAAGWLHIEVEELEEQQKIILQASEMHSQEQKEKHQEQISSLTTALEEAREQQVNLQPFKEHILTQKAKMLQLQTAIEGERCKVLQVDSRF